MKATSAAAPSASSSGQSTVAASAGSRLKADALSNFDGLPESAFVRLPVVSALFNISPATTWRWAKSGRIPSPCQLSKGVTAWRVSDLRKALRGEPWQ